MEVYFGVCDFTFVDVNLLRGLFAERTGVGPLFRGSFYNVKAAHLGRMRGMLRPHGNKTGNLLFFCFRVCLSVGRTKKDTGFDWKMTGRLFYRFKADNSTRSVKSPKCPPHVSIKRLAQ